jgi:hypothetical protein
MKFNPIKRILYTDKGEVITKLSCPYKVSFTGEVTSESFSDHICDICNGEIVDTSSLGDDDLLTLAKTSSNLCIKIDPMQHNVRIVYIQ